MKYIQPLSQKLRSLHFQSIDDAFLIDKLDHDVLLATLLREASEFYFAGLREVLQDLVQLPIGRDVDDYDGSSDLLDLAGVKADWKRRVLGQIIVLQLRVGCFDQLQEEKPSREFNCRVLVSEIITW